MVMNVRMTEKEQDLIRKKAVEINQKLIKDGFQPLRDSQLVHAVLEQCLPYVELGTSGKIIIAK